MITGSELWKFYFISHWPGIRKLKKPRLSLPKIWRLRQARDTKFGTNVSNEILLNAAKCWDYCFYCFWVIKGKPTGGDKNIPSTPKLGLRDQISMSSIYLMIYFFKMNLSLWQHLDINSVHLLISRFFSALPMIYFSVKHKSQCFVLHL